MPEMVGLFANFKNLSQVSVASLIQWLPKTFEPQLIENYLGNRLLYPDFVPTSQREELIDLAILREAIRLSSKSYYDNNLNRIYIPEELFLYFSDLSKLVWAFIDVFSLGQLTALIIKGNVARSAGSILKPKIKKPKGVINILVKNQNKKYSLKTGSLTIIPANLSRVDIKFESTDATLMGQSSIEVEVSGGVLGLVVDARI